MAKEGEHQHSSFHAKDYVDPPPAPLIDAAELKKWSFYRALIAEFIATLLFLYITVLTVIGYKSQVATANDSCAGVGILGIAWAFGGMIFILVYCTAGISGGHINPAVTFGLFLARKVSLIRAIAYTVAQSLGAICGVGLVKAFQKSYYNMYGGGANTLSDGYSTGTGLGAEIIGTFVLVYTVFSATDPKRKARDSHVPPGLVDFPKSMKKLGRSVMKARPFALTLLLLSAKAEGKTPTLEYGIIGKAPPSKSTHPPPVNDPTRGCNAENYCRHFTLSAENPRNSSGTRVEAFARVNVGAPLNSTAPGLEAVAGGIAKWSLKDTKSRRLRVLMNATADADSTLVSQLKLAVCRGIAQKGMDVQYSDGSISSEEMAALSPADVNITITVGAASDQVDLKFMTHVESFGETDVKWILEFAKANILAGGQ